MKTVNYSIQICAFALLFLFGVLSSCGEKGSKPTPTKKDNPFEGNHYKFVSGILAKDAGNLKKDADISKMVATKLFGTKCTGYGGFDLKATKKLAMTCGEGASLNQETGDWSANTDYTELTLNLKAPLVTTSLAVVIKKINTSGNDLTGEGILAIALDPSKPTTLTESTITFKFTKTKLKDFVKTDPFEGIHYKFVSGILAEAIALKNEDKTDKKTLKKGLNVTAMVAAGLFGVTQCTTGNGGFDLKATKKLAMTCIGDDTKTKETGLWTSNADKTVLTLNLGAPLFPSEIVIGISNITISGNDLTGEANLPIPNWIAQGVAMPANPRDVSNFLNQPTLLKIILTFTKEI